MITTLKAPITEWGHTMNMFVSVPSDYDQNPNKLYPVILFFHGKGEAGTDINRVLGAYLPKRIKNGWEPQGTNPKGEVEKFIVIGGQDQYWSPWPTTFDVAFKYVVSNQKLRIDPNRIYTTGLSAGGQTSLMYACWDKNYIGKIAAVASLSLSALDKQALTNLPALAQVPTFVWFWSGNTDGATNDAKTYTKTMNDAAAHEVSTVTVFNGGHCCWDNVYNGAVLVDGKLNVYDWFLTHSLDNVIPNPPDDPCKDCPCPEPAKPLYIMMSDGTKLNVQ